MKQDQEHLEKLKKRFEFNQWAGLNKLRQNLFIWKYKVSTADIPAWVPVRVQQLSLPGQQRLTTSVWKRPDAANVLIGLDVYECESRAAAHDMVVTLLDTFQSPMVTYEPESQTGDVAFSDSSGLWVMFSRANLVVIIRNAGVVLAPIDEAAQSFDGALSSEPPAETTEAGALPRAMAQFAVKAKRATVGSRVEIEVETPEVLDGTAYLKVFSKSGEVYAQDEKLFYRPEAPAEQEVLLYTVVPETQAQPSAHVSAQAFAQPSAHVSAQAFAQVLRVNATAPKKRKPKKPSSAGTAAEA